VPLEIRSPATNGRLLGLKWPPLVNGSS
jgi:hypothetical protein